jgi:hypothetical protein
MSNMHYKFKTTSHFKNGNISGAHDAHIKSDPSISDPTLS